MKALTKKEEQIMEYFWDRGPLFVRELNYFEAEKAFKNSISAKLVISLCFSAK